MQITKKSFIIKNYREDIKIYIEYCKCRAKINLNLNYQKKSKLANFVIGKQ